MISWRYHLVSIVAVFLALGLGVLTGTTVLNDNLVRNLKAQTRTLRTDLDELRASVGDLQSQLGTMEAFTEQAMPYLVGDRLVTSQVIVVTEDGVDGKAVAQARRALDLASAEVLTTLTVLPAMAAGTPTDQLDLARLLGSPGETDPDQLTATAAASLAARLSEDPADVPSETDVLGELLSQGFLTASAPGISDATLLEIGGRGQLVVAIGGSTEPLTPSSSAFMEPFVTSLADLGVTTGAGESLASIDGFVTGVRTEVDSAETALVTVDNVDLPIGGSALVLGLREAIAVGTGGNYGVKAGASRLLPPPP